jgi:hypothetical protein
MRCRQADNNYLSPLPAKSEETKIEEIPPLLPMRRRKAASWIGKDGKEGIGGGCHREGPDLKRRVARGSHRRSSCKYLALLGFPNYL